MEKWEPSDLKNRILILVPHSDDEALLAAGVIRHAVLQQKQVWIAVATNGDYLAEDYGPGRMRMKESLKAAKCLGVPEKRVLFLGYADTGMAAEDSFLYRLYHARQEDQCCPSACSRHTYGLEDGKEDFHFQKTGVHGLYTRKSFLYDLVTLLEEIKPQQIFTTSRYDLHGDHEALSCFLEEAIDCIRKRNGAGMDIEVYEGMVHSCAGDSAWPLLPVSVLTDTEKPFGLEEMTPLKWTDRISIPVPGEMQKMPLELNLKYRLIRGYKSQMKEEEDGVIEFLTAFTKNDEVFWKVEQ